ncbi:hypothetical protein VNO77_17396 [Canavalia gladiata]|uniref:Uncharacterized protein n=1 Tax=Canavalia gladiata TaxID=3824 RepID=A0AAN9QJB9_CANGL
MRSVPPISSQNPSCLFSPTNILSLSLFGLAASCSAHREWAHKDYSKRSLYVNVLQLFSRLRSEGNAVDSFNLVLAVKKRVKGCCLFIMGECFIAWPSNLGWKETYLLCLLHCFWKCMSRFSSSPCERLDRERRESISLAFKSTDFSHTWNSLSREERKCLAFMRKLLHLMVLTFESVGDFSSIFNVIVNKTRLDVAND